MRNERFDVGEGVPLTRREIAERVGCSAGTIHNRINSGVRGAPLLASLMAYARHGATLIGRIEAASIPEPNTGCWLWEKYTDRAGYGKIRVDGKNELAHRASWTAHRGQIPEGMCVCHRCDTPACVNPDHLFLGTISENNTDMKAKGRARGARGESSGRAKLTDAQVVEIRSAPGLQREIAERFGVSQRHVSDICLGKKRRDAA